MQNLSHYLFIILIDCTGDELSALFASCDVFVMPSETETLGFVVLEALASGVPVVGVAAGGLLDIIQHGETGFLAPAGDPNMTDFSGYVSRLKEDPSLRTRISAAGRLWAEQFSWKSATEKLTLVQYPAAIKIHSLKHGIAKNDEL
jgi:sulfoquinovosyltransferase